MITLLICAVQKVLKLHFSFSYHCFSQKCTKHHSLLRKILSQKDAILENNSAGQVSCEAHFSGTWTEVGGAPAPPPPLTGATLCNPETQAVFGEGEAESIEEESSGFYDLKLVASKI